MNNRKGFTLIELLVTITIIGIIMIMTLPAIHNLQRENQKKKFDDYERAVLEAAKAYEDQYEEDLFGRSDTGCASINYVDLVNKKLLTTTKIAGYECNNDKNGIIIRKVKGTSYYEVYLTCNKGNNDIKNLTENTEDYTDIRNNHCNTGEDHDPPTLTIKCDGDNDNSPAHGVQGDDFQTTHIYYYSATNEGEKRIPELTVKASDNITGLEKNQYVTYEWKIYNDKENNTLNKIEKNKTTFNTKDGAGSTAEKKVRIIEEFKKEGSTGKAVIDLSGDNIIDRAGNKLSLEEDSATETCTYYYDNAKPQMEIRITGNNTGREYNTNSDAWINEPITTTVTVTDVTENGIYSGIDPESLTRGDNNEKLSGGMETYSFTKEDSNRNENDVYTICDKVGNCTKQTVKIRVDTTYPICTSKGGDPNWRSTDLKITGNCVDPGDSSSGCRKETYSQVYSAEQSINNATAGQACDNAGNCVMCSEDQHVHIDKTKPECEYTAFIDENVPNTRMNMGVKCTDNSGLINCNNNAVGSNTRIASQNESKEIIVMAIGLGTPVAAGKYSAKVEDKAGNSNTCSIEVVESTCYHYEMINSYHKDCYLSSCGPCTEPCGTTSLGLALFCSIQCPNGQTKQNERFSCNYPAFTTPVVESSTDWECWGDVLKESSAKFCGYHAVRP